MDDVTKAKLEQLDPIILEAFAVLAGENEELKQRISRLENEILERVTAVEKANLPALIQGLRDDLVRTWAKMGYSPSQRDPRAN
jgi:hypothetical protein